MREREKGISLIELLVVMVIFSIIAAAIATAIFSTNRGWAVGASQAVLTSEIRKALDRMSRELAEGRVAEIQGVPADGRWYNTITFRVPQDRSLPPDGSVLDANGDIVEWSDWITYQWGSSNTCQRVVAVPVGVAPVTENLATHITTLQFRRQNITSDMVEVELTASVLSGYGQVMSRTMGTRIKLRN